MPAYCLYCRCAARAAGTGFDIIMLFADIISFDVLSSLQLSDARRCAAIAPFSFLKKKRRMFCRPRDGRSDVIAGFRRCAFRLRGFTHFIDSTLPTIQRHALQPGINVRFLMYSALPRFPAEAPVL